MDRDPADDEHRQKNALPERLHGGHVVRQGRDHQPEPDQRKRDKSKRDEQPERMLRQGHAHGERQAELQQPRTEDDQVTRHRGAHDKGPRRQRREPITPPHAPLALAHHRGRQPEARAAEHADRQQFAHVPEQRDFFVTVEHPKRHEEDQRK